MSKPHKGEKYLANVKPRSGKHPRIQWEQVFGGTTATGWHSYKEQPPERNTDTE